MKTLVWLEATAGAPELAPLWEFLADRVDALAEGRVATRVVHAGIDAGGIRTAPNRLLSDAAVLARAVEVDAGDAADALVIGCWGAPTSAVRAAVGIPATGLADANVRAVGSLARRAVVVTVAESLVPVFADEIDALGSAGFLMDRPVRAYAPESTHLDVLRAIEDPTDLISRFDATARRAVDDGADAIVVGCGYLAPIFAAHGYTAVSTAADVPILDCNRIALEHALHLRTLADAGIAPTARGYLRPVHARHRALASASHRLLGSTPLPIPQEGTTP
ncbi:MAG: hypothetical protein J0I43_04600 [Microbacterium sp.]|uniref:aspartate/glutamate racemase family protein n=1 Tax=Microbacterium sp. TaxID=51671 RepID=UPI001AD12700|nr:aspartate/glutamate racemase family protein [Microbacterium sp.]MBN9176633.1 hypothetical protein [Microbacterium sp.]